MSESSVIVAERMQRRELAGRADATLNPMQLISVAVQQGADLQKIEKLMDLRDRWEATEARKAYVEAMAAFRAEPITILKTKQVDIPGGAKFAHATLADVVDGAVAAMARHGLSHRWEINQANGAVTVTCVITHELGHSERTTLSGAPDDSGKKNAIQQIASTVSYLERYTLMAACGLAAKDMDDDGGGAGGSTKKAERLSKQQVMELQAMITEHGIGMPALLTRWKIGTLADILAVNYPSVIADVKAIAARRREHA